MTTTATTSPFEATTSKRTPSEFALVFAELLTAKFAGGEAVPYTSRCFAVEGGNKMDRIIQCTPEGKHTSVHAFVEKSTGHVYKAAGYAAPAKGVRYTNILEAVEKADLYGSYLYK